MKPTQQLHYLGQSLWLDNSTRGLLTNDPLREYIHDFSVKGLASDATIFNNAIHDTTHAVDGWVFLEVSPLLADDTAGSKDPKASDTPYGALAAPNTINTLPEKTLHAFAERGRVNEVLPPDGGEAEEILAAFAYEGVNYGNLAAELQREGAQAFTRAWQDMLDCLAKKGATLPQSKQI